MSHLEKFVDETDLFAEKATDYVNRKYRIMNILHAFLSCQLLKNDSELRNICICAVRLTTPRSVLDIVFENLTTGDNLPTSVPPAAVISRLRGRIDAAWVISLGTELQAMFETGGGTLMGDMG